MIFFLLNLSINYIFLTDENNENLSDEALR